jgi:hypothetical protein
MDERRRLGQCFNCDEKYVRGHNHTCKHLFLVELSDEAEDDEEQAEALQISLHALTGIKTGETMQVTARIGNEVFHALLDSGSTHSFIAETAATRLSLPLMGRANLFAMVADGERIQCAGFFQQTEFFINKEGFTADLFVLPLGCYDIVLGTRWLATLGPILWDFSKLTMSFWHQDHQVVWRGSSTGSDALLHACTSKNLLERLLAQFADVFSEPQGLPPRSRDHRIHLLPRAAPVAVRPYQYLTLQKDELERQCKSMEALGLIRRSSPAYSSSVLLVKKRDATWRFCVDYCALNDLTVKDKLPIPMVDELLDKLNGARYFTKLDLRSRYHQVRMHPDDIEKTAFRSHDSLFEFLVMPFGLTNAPATFQALMNDVLRPFLR